MNLKRILLILSFITFVILIFTSINHYKKKIKHLRSYISQIQSKLAEQEITILEEQEKISSLEIDNAAYAKFVSSYLTKYENDLANITPEDYLNAQKEPTPYEQISFCIVTPSYNNAAYVKQSLNSIFRQKYHNWKLIYIDDASNDGMSEIVTQIKKDSNLSDEKFKLIRNPERLKSALAGIYYAAYNFCKDEDVLITVDGDDLLATSEVLIELADIYKNTKIWATHGQFINSNDGTLGYCCNHEVSQENWSNSRRMDWSFSHLRTVYTWLFKKIKKEDLQYDNKFLSYTYDMSIMFPVVEMAGKDRVMFVRNIMYLYRLHTSNDNSLHLKEVHFFENYIRNLSKYNQLDKNYEFKK